MGGRRNSGQRHPAIRTLKATYDRGGGSSSAKTYEAAVREREASLGPVGTLRIATGSSRVVAGRHHALAHMGRCGFYDPSGEIVIIPLGGIQLTR